MDEAIKFLNNDYFYPFIREALLEGRKKNNVFVGAIQDLRFLYDNQNGEEFLSSFQSYIIFPSSSATPQHYIGDDKHQGLGLTHDEYEWVKNTPKSKRQFMLKRKDGGSIILDANLAHLGGRLSLLRGDKDIQKTYDNILSKDDPLTDWQQRLINKFD
jgi:type IV secretory pathway VirB4 component